MKFLKLEYPDLSVHNIFVKSFYQQNNSNKYYMSYYDMVNSKSMYATLEKNEDIACIAIDDELVINENDTTIADSKILPREIKFTKNENNVEFVVFATKYALFLNANLCEEYHIGNKNTIKVIKGIKSYEISPEEIDMLEANSKNFKAKYIKLYETQKVITYPVYQDLNSNYYFVAASLCEKTGIHATHKTIINDITHYGLDQKQVEFIEHLTEFYNPCYRPQYIETSINPDDIVEINKSKEVKTNQPSFVYYNDTTNNKYYITRNILELGRSLEIDIEGKPTIINNQNCYSITSEELDLLINSSEYKKIEEKVQLEKEISEEVEVPEENTEVKEEIQVPEVAPVIEETKENTELEIPEEVQIPETVEVPEENIEVTPVPEETTQEDTIEEPTVEEPTTPTIVAYKDKETGNIYLPDNYDPNKKETHKTRTVMNKNCFEITEEELLQITNNYVLATVYLKQMKDLIITVCNFNDTLYISEEILQLFNIEFNDRKKIKVSGILYLKVTNDDIKSINEIAAKSNININFSVKAISPLKSN